MSRKPRKGYFVRGQFVAEGSELDLELKRELRGDEPSKTELKRESAELQALGEALLDLRPALRDPLALPDKLLDALTELRRITHFEGRRRQQQFVGKLMRQLDADTVSAIRAALEEQRLGSSRATQALHEAEHWRDRLIADDAAVTEWLAAHPATDTQPFRALVRQARKDAPAPDRDAVSRGLAPRHGRAYRELFQWVRAGLAPSDAAGADPIEENTP